MSLRHELHPDLNHCVLEDRCLLAYSAGVPPLILTTSGYIVLTTPPGLSSALGSNPSGGGGSGGGNVATSFNISGFGPSSLAIGNATGLPALSAGANRSASAQRGGGGGSNSEGGANAPAPTESRFNGYAATISSGYNTSLDISSNYGMSTSSVGAIPVRNYADRAEQPKPIENPTNTPPVTSGPYRSKGGLMTAPNLVPGVDISGPGVNPSKNLLQGARP